MQELLHVRRIVLVDEEQGGICLESDGICSLRGLRGMDSCCFWVKLTLRYSLLLDAVST